MKLRTHHLVGLILLLSALRGAEGSVLPAGEYALDGRYGVVLSQDTAGVWTEVKVGDPRPGRRIGTGGFFPAPFASPLDHSIETGLASASVATFRTAWTMRPPAAQCAAIHCVTGCAVDAPAASPSL